MSKSDELDAEVRLNSDDTIVDTETKPLNNKSQKKTTKKSNRIMIFNKED
jgi:hypothetical protein